MDYTTFCEMLNSDTEDRFVLVLDYDEFQVWYDADKGISHYLECGENDASDCFEVELIADLAYSAVHDLKIKHDEAGLVLSELFDCDCCGECVLDDEIHYYWFKKVS